MVEVRDSSVIPEPLFETMADGEPIANVVSKMQGKLPDLVALMFRASSGNDEFLDEFVGKLDSDDLLTRYWATIGCLALGKEAKPAKAKLRKLASAQEGAIRIAAAHALTVMGHDSLDLIAAEVGKDQAEMVRAYAMTILYAMDASDRVPEEVLKSMAKAKMNYGSRFAKQLLQLRSESE